MQGAGARSRGGARRWGRAPWALCRWSVIRSLQLLQQHRLLT